MSGELLEEHAREKLGEDATWRVFRWHNEWAVFTLTGKRARLFLRGPRKGKPDWKTPGESRNVHITHAEHDEWCKRWQERTGGCIRCEGSGQTFKRWDRETGVETRACQVCQGSGKKVQP